MLVIAILCAVATGCSSSAGQGATSPVASPSHAGAPSASDAHAAVQHYLDAVNALCDALLPKVIAVTNGGSLDIPRKAFFAQLPAHARLLAGFDRHLAKIPVPPAAEAKAAAFAAYIRFANRLDARRLAAAKRGKAAYAKEIAAESGAADDPTIAARDAAGFNQSCNAR
jgi:hypothetical protein